MKMLFTSRSTKARPVLLASLLFVWAAVIVALTGCDSGSEPRLWKFSGNTMGTTYHISVVIPAAVELPPELSQANLQERIDQTLETVNQQMSTYRATSELMRLNEQGLGTWHAVSAELFHVLSLSRQISEASGGAFDVTVGPLVDLWGFGAGSEPAQILPAPPPPEQIQALLAQQVGYQAFELRQEPLALRKTKSIAIDLSAIAKGYGADAIARVFERQGLHDYLIEVGGELRLAGLNQRGKPWRIGIERPQLSQGGAQKAIAVTDAGMATSGDYRNYFEHEGQRYSHTLDPRTGSPVTHRLASVTVIAPTAAEADAWATALNVVGPQEAIRVANRHQLAVFLLVKEEDNFAERYSVAFEPYLTD